jgi:membrane protein DedA with SNARE-associated domain
MENFITNMMDQFGYFGVFFLIALENLFPPIPSEVILTFGGFMTTKTSLTVIGVITAATIGSVFGAIILYTLGRIVDVSVIERFVARWEKVLRISPKDIRKASAWFEKHGKWTVFFCRLIPLIRSLISIPAGMTKMSFGLFLVLTTLGSLIWNILLVTVGAYVGDQWETIVHYMDIYSNVTYAALALIFVLFVWWFFYKYKKKKS